MLCSGITSNCTAAFLSKPFTSSVESFLAQCLHESQKSHCTSSPSRSLSLSVGNIKQSMAHKKDLPCVVSALNAVGWQDQVDLGTEPQR